MTTTLSAPDHHDCAADPDCPNEGTLPGNGIRNKPYFCSTHRAEWQDHNRRSR